MARAELQARHQQFLADVAAGLPVAVLAGTYNVTPGYIRSVRRELGLGPGAQRATECVGCGSMDVHSAGHLCIECQRSAAHLAAGRRFLDALAAAAPGKPTSAPPGSPERQALYAARQLAGLPIHLAADRVDLAEPWAGFLAAWRPQGGRGVAVPADLGIGR
jgi:hypothetical protein